MYLTVGKIVVVVCGGTAVAGGCGVGEGAVVIAGDWKCDGTVVGGVCGAGEGVVVIAGDWKCAGTVVVGVCGVVRSVGDGKRGGTVGGKSGFTAITFRVV